jgi:putative transcriptional regulator
MPMKCNLQDLLWSKRLKMADVVRMTGISKTTIHSMYHDRVTKVDYGVVEKLCAALECTPGDLFVLGDAENAEGVEANVTSV